MKAIHVAVASFFVLCSFLSSQVVNAQDSNPAHKASIETSASKSEESRIIRIATGALNVTIDDSEKPFRLENLNRRFDAKSLIKFLNGYVVKSRQFAIVVTSNTKRDVEGEQEFNEFLERVAKKPNVLIVYMPPPTGDDPDADLKSYAKDFQSDANH